MADIVFDGRKLQVPDGQNLVDAGLAAGVPVPVFCYHKDLGAVGSCRVCAVTVTGADGKAKTVMACMTGAQNGMNVTTLDPESVALRKQVIEWLMLNHPHDCPICDEGGECQLQDLTIAGGHSQRRLKVPKRTFENQYLGEFISHEMNRCITCYRCVRFYQDYAGGRDFGQFGSRSRVYFGRDESGPLESPFSGNLIEMCPTGVFTDKLFRYTSRVWDLEMNPSICPHCSVGCNVLPGSRMRELQRVRVRGNEQVNGVFMCDRGQFGHGYVMDPARPRAVRAGGSAMDWDDAIGLAGGELLSLARRHGAGAVAAVASARASVEAHAALEALATGPLEGMRVAHFDDVAAEGRALAALEALAGAGCPPLDNAAISECDVLLIAGTSLVDEAPMAALAARQTARRGGRVFVVAPIERYLNEIATVVPTAPHQLAAALKTIAGALGAGASGGNGTHGGGLEAIGAALGSAKRAGILMGSELLDGAAIAAGADLAQAVKARGSTPRFGYLFPGPNGHGAAAISRGPVLESILADLVAGKLQALVVVESDGGAWSRAAIDALGKLELGIVLDYLDSPAAKAARVFLPSTATYESFGSYVNRAGRLQAFVPSRVPGASVRARIADESFPRDYRVAPPDGDARMAWQILELLREAALGQPEARALGAVRADLAARDARWAPLPGLVAGTDGVMLEPRATGAAARVPEFAASGDGLVLHQIERTLGSEPLSRRSAAIREMAGPPVAWVSAATAARHQLGNAAQVRLEGQAFDVAVRVHPAMADGTVLVSRDAGVAPGTPQGARVTSIAKSQAAGFTAPVGS